MMQSECWQTGWGHSVEDGGRGSHVEHHGEEATEKRYHIHQGRVAQVGEVLRQRALDWLHKPEHVNIGRDPVRGGTVPFSRPLKFGERQKTYSDVESMFDLDLKPCRGNTAMRDTRHSRLQRALIGYSYACNPGS